MLTKIVAPSNLRKAFSRVEASRGMAGVDGVSIRTFKRNLKSNLATLGLALQDATYRPLPLLRFLAAKPDGSPRVLTVPTVRDRVAQAAVLNVIEPIFEAEFEDVSFAYRKGRSVRQAAYRIKELRDKGYRYVVDADIDAYFDNVRHEILMTKLAGLIEDDALVNLVRLWVQAEVYDGSRVYRLQRGIPQGSVVSPMLANLFLDELDEAMLARGIQIVRYSDDFILLAKTREQACRALEVTGQVLAELDLVLDAEDTCVTDFAGGFKYLGLIFIGDSILAPFDKPPKEKKILYMPPPFDLQGYVAGKRSWP